MTLFVVSLLLPATLLVGLPLVRRRTKETT